VTERIAFIVIVIIYLFSFVQKIRVDIRAIAKPLMAKERGGAARGGTPGWFT